MVAHQAVLARFQRYEQTAGHNSIINARQFGGDASAATSGAYNLFQWPTIPPDTLCVPAYSMTKASYALSMAAPLGLALADGFARLRGLLAAPGWSWASFLLDGWAGTLLLVIALSYVG